MKKCLFIFIAALCLTACASQGNPFLGNVYVHYNGPEKQFIGFDERTIIFKWDDSLGVEAFETPYTFKKTNDSSYSIILEKKNDYMESNEIKIIKSGDGFYSADSKKMYVLQRK